MRAEGGVVRDAHTPEARKHAHGTYFSVTRIGAGPRPAHRYVIPKRVAPRAVDRNRAKRRSRAAVRESMSETLPPLVLSVRIKPAALKAPYARLKDEMTALVRQLRS